MRLKLHECTVDLPSGLSVEERNNFVKNILEEYPGNFITTGDLGIDKLPNIRLDILATYILQGVKDIRKDKTIMSRYKEKRRPFQETVISNLSNKQKSGNLGLKNKYYSINDEIYKNY